MKKTTKFKAKIVAGASILSCVGIMSASSAMAWGPERATFTMDNPATYPTFNSITDNPTIGDERDFVRVGEINADVTNLKNEIEVVPGRQYLVYIYFHNNASSTYNDAAHNNSGVAFQTRMSTSFSTVLTPSERGVITGTISAENSNPTAVWDEAYMTTQTDKVLLHYVAGSAKIYNDFKANGSVMPSSLFSEQGTYLGLNSLNGIILGCEEYHGAVSYVLQAEELGGSIDKTVSKDGETYRESTNLQPSEEAYFQLAIQNTGDVALTNAVIKDVLPEGLSLVPGTVQLRANESTTWDQLTDDILGNGLNLGTIGTGNVVYVRYKVKAGEDFDCTGKELTNHATLTYDSEVATGDTKEDKITVTVKKEDGCEETNPPLDNCETNPSLPGCQEKNCKTNPEMEGCQELPNTGPVEIIMAIVIVLGIGAAGYYLYRTRRTLKTVEGDVSGKDADTAAKETEDKEDSSQKPENMV
ncbi:DUF11 domain-containing protein [Candidatus Saccharibacteria bacterium]|nr:DUF11 domain-containing protein [Candidatus Saccharibacteria bacterium]